MDDSRSGFAINKVAGEIFVIGIGFYDFKGIPSAKDLIPVMDLSRMRILT